jgi:acetoin utilization protein AcuC
MRKAAFIHSKQLELYPYPPDCPFNTSRAGKVRDILNSMGLLSGPGISEVAPEAAERVVLKKFHSAHYLHILQGAEKGRWDIDALNMGIGTSDCPIFKGMYDYSALACGATLTGANLILSGSADIAFNPSGGLHHAAPERAAGFCYMNDVALGCLVLAEAGKRVLYLDIDVHFSDGVSYAFYDRSDVMTISFHETGKMLFPGTGFEDEIGTGAGKGYCVNVPLPAGTYDEVYMKAFHAIAVPLIEVYNPDVIVFELGADALAGDPLAHLYLTNNVYADIIQLLLNFNKPILATGGGGYHIGNTVRAWALAWSVLSGDGGHDLNLGIGGIMMESTDWQGGFRDRELVVNNQQRDTVAPAVDEGIQSVKAHVFPYHGL